MRIIDADALIEGYKHMGYDPTEHPEESYMEGWCKGFNSATDHCMHHVIHAPTVEQPEQRWIPSGEKPPKEGRYLVWMPFAPPEERIAVANFCDGYWNIKTPISAWMPLPEPYRGGDE